MRYYMMHKPRGVITAVRDARRPTVMDGLMGEEYAGLFPVGRLDKDTEGLLLLTDDGGITARLLHPSFLTPKTYEVYALGELSCEAQDQLRRGTFLDAAHTVAARPADITVKGTCTLGQITDRLDAADKKRARRRPSATVTHAYITVTEGKWHQVKRMLLSVGCRVLYLRRLSMGPLTLDPTLPVGEVRPLTDEERTALEAFCRKRNLQ